MTTRGTRDRSVAREAASVLAAQVVSHVTMAVLLVFLAHALGTDQFGLFRLAVAIATIGIVLASQGVSSATGRYLARAGTDGWSERSIVVRAGKLKVACSFALALGLVALGQPLATVLGEPRIAPLVPLVALIVVAGDLTTWLAVVFQSTRRASATVVMAVARSCVEVVAVLVLVWAGFGTAGAITANGLGYLAACAVGLVLAGRRLTASGVQVGPTGRELMSYGRQIWYAEVAFIGFATVDQLMLQVFDGTRSVGVYDAAWQLATAPQLLGSALCAAVAPRLASMDRVSASALFGSIAGLVVALYAALAVIVAALAVPLVEVVLARPYARSADVLLALGPYLLLAGVAPLVSVTPNYLGLAGSRGRIALTTLGINAMLDAVLIPWLGVIGPALATGVALAVYVAWHLALCGRRLDIPYRSLVRATLVGLGAGLAAGAVGYGVVHVTPGGLFLRTIGAGLAAGSVALILLALAGALRRDQLALIGVPRSIRFPLDR